MTVEPEKTRWKLTPQARAWIVRRYLDGQAIGHLSRAFGVGTSTIRYHLLQAGVTLRARADRADRPTLTGPQRSQIARRYGLGENVAKIAQDFGISVAYVRKVARQRGVPPRQRTKMSQAEIDAILRRYFDGVSLKWLADKHGVNRVTIWRWLKRANRTPRRR